jgi:lariat debranching enzyme
MVELPPDQAVDYERRVALPHTNTDIQSSLSAETCESISTFYRNHFTSLFHMKIMVTGCLHGEWELLVRTVNELLHDGTVIDLIIVAGDCETMRTEEDLKSYKAPPRYQVMGTFHKVYNGELHLPRLTLLIGGNHEASDVLHVLPFGGWLAPNVFYLGRACSVSFGDTVITSLSGLWKPEDYWRPVNEAYPIRSEEDKATTYHIRAFSDFQLHGLTKTDLFVSHDWPAGIPDKCGGAYLQSRRPDLIDSDRQHSFGLPHGLKLVQNLNPGSWFAAHHHIPFSTKIPNSDTMFYACGKPPRDGWFMMAEIDGTIGPLKYSGEWIAILKATAAEMADPATLQNSSWEQRWSRLKPELAAVDDCEVGPFELDPFQYTIAFCRQHGVYCPNEEIRQRMAQEAVSST